MVYCDYTERFPDEIQHVLSFRLALSRQLVESFFLSSMAFCFTIGAFYAGTCEIQVIHYPANTLVEKHKHLRSIFIHFHLCKACNNSYDDFNSLLYVWNQCLRFTII